MKSEQQRGDRLLFPLALAGACLGLALVWSATRYEEGLRHLPQKQGLALLAGVGLCMLLAHLPLRRLTERGWGVLLAGNVGLLLLLIPLGNEDGTGNKSWINLPGGFWNLQPAEVVKLGFILLLALHLAELRRRGINRPTSVLAVSLHALGMVGLLYGVSGDLGMGTVYLGVYFIMLWGAGVHPLWCLGELAAGAGCLVLLWPRLPDYVRMRFLVVLDHTLDPLGKGFQQERSLLALGSGQITGQGYLAGTQTQSASPSALPARHTDFIFSVAGEEWGLVGCGVILLLLTLLVLRCFRMARRGKWEFFSLTALGVGGMFGVQTLLNLGMCLYLAPVIGVTLPFFSYGGSSLVASFGGVGLLLGLEREERREKRGGSRPLLRKPPPAPRASPQTGKGSALPREEDGP